MAKERTECDNHSNSSFIFGLLIGAVIGALIAIIIYKNNKTKVFEDLQNKLSNYFKKFTNSNVVPKNHSTSKTKKVAAKTSAVKPISIVMEEPTKQTETKIKSPVKSRPKMFIKPKR